MEFFFGVPQLNGVSDKGGIEPCWTWFDCSFTELPWPMWHGKPVSTTYFSIWDGPAYIKGLVGGKLGLYRFICYPKKNWISLDN